RRALDNGKLDLVQVEGLADLINAETQGQRRLALRQAGGAMSERLETWRQRLVRARAYLEAEIDFPEEDDVPGSVSDQIWDDLAVLRQEFVNHVEDRTAERLRSGVEMVVVGAPNAGKSSLVNALAQRDVAIVTDIAGTTRDLLEVRMDLAGVPVTLVDTAGLRARVHDPIEREGARRALARAATADLTLRLVETDGPAGADDAVDGDVRADLLVRTKSDLMDSASQRARNDAVYDGVISVKTGAGMGALIALLTARAGSLAHDGGAAVVTRQRHREALRDAANALTMALEDGTGPLEMRAEHLRRAAEDLARVTGASHVDELLDVVFRDFCMGK
ncbi:MAG: tRNA modification GTPase, partial [Alphaproteobacteria bacterium]